MILTKNQIEEAIRLEQAWSDHLANTRTPEEEDLGIVFSADTAGKHIDKFLAIMSSQQCRALKDFLRGLSEEEFKEFQAVMYIGRGDYKPTEFEKACEEPGLSPERERDVTYVIEKMCAANYLADGFEKLNSARII